MNIKLFYANVRSIVNKINEFKSYIYGNDIDICVINETWLKNYIPDNSILNNYFLFRNDREDRGGGVLIAVKNSYKCNQKFFDSNGFEDIFVEICVNQKQDCNSNMLSPHTHDIN